MMLYGTVLYCTVRYCTVVCGPDLVFPPTLLLSVPAQALAH